MSRHTLKLEVEYDLPTPDHANRLMAMLNLFLTASDAKHDPAPECDIVPAEDRIKPVKSKLILPD